MPLSLELTMIAEQFRLPFRLQRMPISLALHHLVKWLEPRVKQAELLESQYRDFPFVQFYNDAVKAWLDDSQRLALAAKAPPHSLWDSFANGGRRFVAGLGRIPNAVREEMVLPNFAAALERAVAVVVASVDRFRTPTTAMFYPGLRTASDLFGEFALAFRAFTTSMAQIRAAAAGGMEFKRALREVMGSDEAATGAKTGPDDDLVAMLEGYSAQFADLTRYLVAGLLLAPLLGRLVDTLLLESQLTGKLYLLRQLEKVEQRLYAWRARILDMFYVGLMGQVQKAARFGSAIGTVLLNNMRFYGHFVMLYALEFIKNLALYFTRLRAFLKYWTDLLEAIRKALQAIMDFNLTPLLLSVLGPVGDIVNMVGEPPALTVGDLFDFGVGVGAGVARAVFGAWLTAADKAMGAGDAVVNGFKKIPLLPTSGIPSSPLAGVRKRVRALRDVLDLTLTPTEPLPAEAAEPVIPSFPNVYGLMLGPSGARYLGLLLKNMGDEARVDILDAVNAVRDGLWEMGDRFDEAAARSGYVGPLEAYRKIAERADALAAAGFGDQAAELRRKVAEAAPTALENWLRGRGFFTLGEAIPLYVRAMRDYWREEARRLPTSPHILARRAEVGRVKVNQMTVRAPGRPLTGDLAEEVADRFRELVQQAYAQAVKQGA